ncbi:hypothetical protein BDN72DRAFT_771498 [Pluteus cervinus]|uniref:Uncharacterized protein n=1 Tax=Pluteus cervinus TaxID=181527 RepID=A0ACD3ALL6_9AGAR|nr:hypothetical protein BDN72DRAFT_771498 [Pluteus cervinus]
MWGSSTRNTRIERLWVEVGSQFARLWRAFFFRLERSNYLDRTDASHLWLIHLLFMNEINDDCDEFTLNWNTHPLSGKGRGQSPQDLYLLGQIEHGIYVDECEGLTAEEINAVYGIEGEPQRRPAGVGAGTTPSEFESDDEGQSDRGDAMDVDEETGEDVRMEVDVDEYESDDDNPGNIVHAPENTNPFATDGDFDAFRQALESLEATDIIPDGYGLRPEEWGADGYPVIETIHNGQLGKGRRSFMIPLPDEVWRPRAVRWARAHYLLNAVLAVA